MKIEKLNENKIRITLNLEDLKEKNIDFHSFMSNPIESQSIFLDMLDTAEKEIGFVTKDYRITIEAFALYDGNFVLTVTRDFDETANSQKRKIHIKRKSIDLSKAIAIYKFASFEELYDFCQFIRNASLHSNQNIVKNTSLYEYNNKYYLVFKNIHGSLEELKGFCCSVTEFGIYINNSDLFERKLIEYGTKIIECDSINVILEKFN